MSEQKSEKETQLLRVLAANSTCEGSDLDVLVTVTPPPGEKRTPVDMVCVVDVSGSMGTEASIKDKSGSEERHGLSLLDVVKHAVKTICNILDENDRLGIVSYSDNAVKEIGLTSCGKKGTKKLTTVTDGLHTKGLTNLWDGLREGMEILRRNKKKGRAQAVLLLTDGLPNVNPPRGELEMLKRYRDEHGTDILVSTFGFGYQLNSVLLDSLAVEGNGSYCFIPDASFVGTVFIHAASNILTTWANTATVSLEPMNDAKITGVLGGHPATSASWGEQVRIGSLLYGQSRDLVVRLSLPEGGAEGEASGYVNASLKLASIGGEDIQVSVEGSAREGGGSVVAIQAQRSIIVETLTNALTLAKKNDLAGAQAVVAKLVDSLEEAKIEDPLAEGLLKDASGQGTESLSKAEYFTKWGRHYLPSLIRAHQLQQCNNFKDPGVQLYGGALFQSTRDAADDIFLKLPAPKPSAAPARSGYRSGGLGLSSGGGGGGASYANFSMSSYHRSSNPCFADGDVLMADLTFKSVTSVKKGDCVFCPDLPLFSATVVCVVKTLCDQGKALLCNFQGLQVTPWHPVRLGGSWKFPADLAPKQERQCEAVYSFVLDNGHVMLINGVPCVTFGHNLKGSVVEHAYFGTSRILEDLREMPGWERGLVELSPGCTVRDENSGLIKKLVYQNRRAQKAVNRMPEHGRARLVEA